MSPDVEQNGPEELPEDLDQGVRETLARLRAATRLTGALHDAQVLQLKHWPRVLFPCDQHSVDTLSEERVLVIKMRLTEDLQEGEDLKRRIKTFERWCWALLGPEWSIRLRTYRKGGRTKELHRGRRKVALPKAAKPAKEYGMEAITEFRRYRRPNAEAASQVANEVLEPLLQPRKP